METESLEVAGEGPMASGELDALSGPVQLLETFWELKAGWNSIRGCLLRKGICYFIAFYAYVCFNPAEPDSGIFQKGHLCLLSDFALYIKGFKSLEARLAVAPDVDFFVCCVGPLGFQCFIFNLGPHSSCTCWDKNPSRWRRGDFCN
ncbi:hypothetical protein AVEN_203073-1 [Araneus ventricosus]|uniref:Uncharacterized protein n=1 Tax=Araneus ventricosus TaxID=182803 RepID=A0A4Y2RVC0_ARAVE|nr:hypothetical protein AVEN_25167-1 [Araneus ventricosus]GBN79808.1 hypothetical protein AVEN_155504-1 [Araneus ventricosus]GBN79822.1 hypothetical protein AVEN_199221-1 [Araneus ventricosus]GBN79824.1 hypothetical protein AVEN_203073-1 [Araneus ventricosus]